MVKGYVVRAELECKANKAFKTMGMRVSVMILKAKRCETRGKDDLEMRDLKFDTISKNH